MNLLQRSALLAFLVIGMFTYSSCSDEEVTKEPEVIDEIPPAVLGSKIFKDTYPANNTILSIKDSVVISFNEKNGKVKTIDNVKYRAVVDQASLNEVSTSAVWAADSLSVTLYPSDMLSSNASFEITVKAHWEVYKTNWTTVVWEENELRETEILNFTTLLPEFEIENTNLVYMYPIPNQYHFLVEEHAMGFVKLKRGQESLFNLGGYTVKAVFKKLTGETAESEVVYDNTEDQIAFGIPPALSSETIYQFQLVVRQSGTGTETVLMDYHFRTSKYRTFTEKFNALTYSGSTFSILMAPWRGHYLHQMISGAGEYFDSFESEVKHVSVELGGTTYEVPYSSNLVRLEAVMAAGNPWYDNLYPLLYAPWTESTFYPTVSRDVSVLGNPPVKAMSFYNAGTGQLTPSMIQSNLAPAISAEASPAIRNSLSLIVWKDFIDIQEQVVQKYINYNPIPSREHSIIFGSMPTVSHGTYAYKVHYTLPSGAVTTTLNKIMVY